MDKKHWLQSGVLISLMLTVFASYADDEHSGYQGADMATLKELLPRWAIKDMRLEAKPMDAQLVDFAGRHRLSVQGQVAEPPEWSDEADGWFFEVELGGDAVMDCYLLDYANDTLDTMLQIRDTVADWYVEEGLEKVQSMQLYAGAHLQSGSPVYALDEARYYTKSGSQDTEAALLYIQGRVSYLGSNTLSCMLADVGYRQTLDRVFNGMVDSWVNEPYRASLPYFRQIYTARVNGQDTGFVDIRFYRDEDGDTKSVMMSSFLLKAGPAQFTASDRYLLDYSTPEGDLINAFANDITNGEVMYALSLYWQADQGWGAEGNQAGEKVSFEIPGNNTIRSLLGQARDLRTVATDSSVNELSGLAWSAESDPATLIPVTYRSLNNQPGNKQVSVAVGPIDMSVKVSDDGMTAASSMQMDEITIDLVPVFKQGEF